MNIVCVFFIIRYQYGKKKFEDTKGVFRNRRSNDGQYHCQKKTCKRRNNVIHNTTQKLKIKQQKPH